MESGHYKLSPKEEAIVLEEAAKREEVLKKAIELFKDEQAGINNKVLFKESAANDITDSYYAVIYTYFKHFVGDRIESSKVSSAMEMAVIMALPIESSSKNTFEEINAIFAYQIGAIFSIGLKEWDIAKMNFNNTSYEREFITIIRDHRIMLEGLISHEPLQSFPLASNAQYWKLLEFIFNIRGHISPYLH